MINSKDSKKYTQLVELLVKLFSNSSDDRQYQTIALSQFTLNDLFIAVKEQSSEFAEASYSEFKDYLYRNQTNTDLAKSGFKVILVKNNGHIDNNLYRAKSV